MQALLSLSKACQCLRLSCFLKTAHYQIPNLNITNSHSRIMSIKSSLLKIMKCHCIWNLHTGLTNNNEQHIVLHKEVLHELNMIIIHNIQGVKW